MKTKLLLFALMLFTSLGFAQIPTDHIFKFSFASGSLINESQPGIGDFNANGTSRTLIADRFGTANSAIKLNQDVLFTPRLTAETNNITEFTLSFWVNPTSTYANTSKKYIHLDGSDGTSLDITDTHNNFSDEFSFNGRAKKSNGVNLDCTNNLESFTLLYDNNWHHVVVRAFAFNSQFIGFNYIFDNVEVTRNGQCGFFNNQGTSDT